MQGHVASCKVACRLPTLQATRLHLGPLRSSPLVLRRQHYRIAQIYCKSETQSKEDNSSVVEDTPTTREAAAAASRSRLRQPRRPQIVEREVERADALKPEWRMAEAHRENCDLLSGTILRTFKSGVTVKVGILWGFIPYSLLNPARLPEHLKSEYVDHPVNGYPELLGKSIKFKVVQIDVAGTRLICSERQAMLEELARKLKKGDLVQGKVTKLRDFGAGVAVQMEEKSMDGVEVLLPIREISYDYISDVSAVLSLGQELTCVVTYVVPPPQAKVFVSLRKMQECPLGQGSPQLPKGARVKPEDNTFDVNEIKYELAKLEGVEKVSLGRRAMSATAIKGLEIWLTKEEVSYGFNMVARTGKVVQELIVVTGLTREDMQERVQRMLDKLLSEVSSLC